MPKAESIISSSIANAVSALSEGGVVALPTDTLYGLSANALDETAASKVFSVKGRQEFSPLPVFVSDTSGLHIYGRDIPDLAERLAEEFWPGKLTIVVRKSKLIPAVVSGGFDTVGLRCPNHSVPRDVVRELGAPITATSANVSGKPPLTSAHDVASELGTRLDMVFDGGQLAPSMPSTVIDATVNPPKILREGALSREELSRVAGFAPGV